MNLIIFCCYCYFFFLPSKVITANRQILWLLCTITLDLYAFLDECNNKHIQLGGKELTWVLNRLGEHQTAWAKCPNNIAEF